MSDWSDDYIINLMCKHRVWSLSDNEIIQRFICPLNEDFLMNNSIVRSVRIDIDLFNKFDSIYGKEFLGKFVNQALSFALKGKEYFSVIFWQEYSNIVFNKE